MSMHATIVTVLLLLTHKQKIRGNQGDKYETKEGERERKMNGAKEK